MANDQAPRAAAKSGMSFLLMAAAILLIAGLMGWLAMQRQDEGATTVAEADTTAAQVDTGAPPEAVVSDTAFEQNIKSYRGRVIEIASVQFSAGLSPQTFWVDLPTGQPFLVKLDSAMVARGAAVPTSGRLSVIGTVQEKTPELVAQWVQQGVLEDDQQRMQAEFGSSYIEARLVRPAR